MSQKMNLSTLKFITPKQVDTLANVSTERSEAPSKILCQNCHVNDRANTGSLLCDDCLAESNEIRADKKLEYKNGALPVLESPSTVTQLAQSFNPEELPIETNGKHEIKAIRFAPPSIRYDGKALDDIAWSMLPAIPANVLLDINKLVINDARSFVNQNVEPTVQDLDVNAEYFFRLASVLKELATKQKSKIVLAAKPEYKRLEKERKEKEKSEKIQSAIPKDVISKHAANILLNGIAEIVAPPDKAVQSIIKAFLDHVQLQSQVEDEINGEWLSSQLNMKRYQPIKQYFKINQTQG
jgi:hypothetical protein